jgi:hypothetical protein
MGKILGKLMLGIALLGLAGAGAHPIHLSLTTIDCNARSKSLEITHRFFVDDFEKEVEAWADAKLRLGTPQEHAQADSLLRAYLALHFSLRLNDKPAAGVFVGKEVEAEHIWIYVEVPDVKKLRKAEVRHTSLLGRFDDQRNLVNFSCEGEKKAVILDAQRPSDFVSF